MTREEKIEILHNLPYTLIWPGDWDDVLGTERELWINNFGYGYIMCDEPTAHWEGNGLDEATWLPIQEKIKNRTIEYTDIVGTVLEELLEVLLCDDYCKEDAENLYEILDGLLELKNGPTGYFYALATDTIEPLFFDSEAAFKEQFEKDYADEYWEDMDDSLLQTWIDRLIKENDKKLREWSIKNNLIQNKDLII